jgi:serine protease AprX
MTFMSRARRRLDCDLHFKGTYAGGLHFEAANDGQAKKVSKNFFMISGTGMAAPVVSGAAADLIQLDPSLTPDQVKLLLIQTAYKTFPTSRTVTDPATGKSYTFYYDIFSVGAGYLDLGAAAAAL